MDNSLRVCQQRVLSQKLPGGQIFIIIGLGQNLDCVVVITQCKSYDVVSFPVSAAGAAENFIS